MSGLDTAHVHMVLFRSLEAIYIYIYIYIYVDQRCFPATLCDSLCSGQPTRLVITCRLGDGRGISFHGGGLGNQPLKAFSSPLRRFSSQTNYMGTACRSCRSCGLIGFHWFHQHNLAAGQFCYHEHCGFAEYASWTARPSARMRGGILISKQIQKDNENGENGALLEEFKAFGDADCDKYVALERNAFPVKVRAIRAWTQATPSNTPHRDKFRCSRHHTR